jgi:hypothetical protein
LQQSREARRARHFRNPRIRPRRDSIEDKRSQPPPARLRVRAESSTAASPAVLRLVARHHAPLSLR